MKQVNYAILGRTRLRIGDRLDDQWGEPKLRAMLAALLLQPRRPVPVSELAEWIWPDDKIPKNPQATFYTYANRIRNALELMAEPPKLTNTGGAYRIEVDREKIDLFQFRETVERARSAIRDGRPDWASAQLAAALELWVDEPLADLQGERARNWRLAARDDHWIPAIDIQAQSFALQGRFDDILRRIADLPVEMQCNLALVKRRLEALYRLRRVKEAKTVFLGLRKRLLIDFDTYEADDLRRFFEELDRNHRTAAAGLPARRQPFAAGATAALRYATSDFVGRDDLLDRLDSVVTASTGGPVTGVIVLHGAAGVGKTALAIHWANRIGEVFPDSILSLELNGYIDGPMLEPDAAVDQLLDKLGVPSERIPTPAGRATKLRNVLTGRRTLTILDKARDSAHVAPLIDCLSVGLVLVTSRRALTGLGRWGAVNIPVWPLPDDDCRAWLSRRLPERVKADSDAVALLAEQCGGIPLTLRLVAEHIAARPQVPTREFVEELRDTHALIGLGDDGDGPDSSVRAAFSCSYRELGSDEQRVFRLLGLHPGPDISIEAAAALVGQDLPQAKRNLDALVNAHLITQPQSRSRYRFHDLLRTYAAERVNAAECAAERAAAENRMLAFYTHSANHADRIVFPFQPGIAVPPMPDGVVPLQFRDDRDAMDWCVRERVNLNAVIRYAGTRRLHKYASLLPFAVGEMAQRLGYHEEVATMLTIALDSYRATADLGGEADALYNLGVAHLERRDFRTAESYFAAAGDRFRQVEDELSRAAVIYRVAQLQVERGDVRQGIESQTIALEVARRFEAPGLEVKVLYRMAEAYRCAGDLAAAHSHGNDALWRAERLGDLHCQGLCLSELGFICYQQGDLVKAKGFLLRALVIHERVCDGRMAGTTSRYIAMIYQDLGDPAEAENWLRHAIDYSRTALDHRGEAIAKISLAELQYSQGRSDEALASGHAALTTLDELADPQASVVRELLERIPSARHQQG